MNFDELRRELTPEKLAEKLKAFIAMPGSNYTKLCRRAGMPKSTVDNYLQADSEPSISRALILFHLLEEVIPELEEHNLVKTAKALGIKPGVGVFDRFNRGQNLTVKALVYNPEEKKLYATFVQISHMLPISRLRNYYS